jgi:hypothetical protein
MAERVDFSANAPRYDRRHGSVLADNEVDALIVARLGRGDVRPRDAAPDSQGNVLDDLSATGNVANHAVALAEDIELAIGVDGKVRVGTALA